MAAILNIIIRLSGVISDSMLFRLQLLMLNCLTSIPGPKKEDKMRPIILRALLKQDSLRKKVKLNLILKTKSSFQNRFINNPELKTIIFITSILSEPKKEMN